MYFLIKNFEIIRQREEPAKNSPVLAKKVLRGLSNRATQRKANVGGFLRQKRGASAPSAV